MRNADCLQNNQFHDRVFLIDPRHNSHESFDTIEMSTELLCDLAPGENEPKTSCLEATNHLLKVRVRLARLRRLARVGPSVTAAPDDPAAPHREARVQPRARLPVHRVVPCRVVRAPERLRVARYVVPLVVSSSHLVSPPAGVESKILRQSGLTQIPKTSAATCTPVRGENFCQISVKITWYIQQEKPDFEPAPQIPESLLLRQAILLTFRNDLVCTQYGLRNVKKRVLGKLLAQSLHSYVMEYKRSDKTEFMRLFVVWYLAHPITKRASN